METEAVYVVDQQPVAGPWAVTRDEYFLRHEKVSNSMMVDYSEHGSVYYHGVYIAGTITRKPPTDDMNFGTAFHIALEPERFAKEVVVSPVFEGKGSVALRKSFETLNAGKVIIDEQEHATIRKMLAGMERNQFAAECLAAARAGVAKAEQPIYWTDPDTGLAMKALLDLVLDNGLVGDIKTTANPSPESFSRSCGTYRYHRQAAHYLAGAKLSLAADGPFVFLAVGKEEPYECVAHVLDQMALDLGAQQNARYALEISLRMETGDWSSRWADKIQEISLPRWCFYE